MMDFKSEKKGYEHESIALSDTTTNDDEDSEQSDERGKWASQMDYLLTVVGYCVALGNFWRFPYICNRNGGGAFLIPFLICLVLCGLPLFFLEVALGQFSGRSPIHVWSMCPLVKGLGVGMLIASAICVAYYTVICAWSLYYTVFSCRTVLPWTTCGNDWNTEHCVTGVKVLNQQLAGILNETMFLNGTNATAGEVEYQTNETRMSFNGTLSHTAAEEFFQYKALSISSGIDVIGELKWELVLCLVGSWLIILMCIVKGVRSVGKAVYVTATLPYVILIILLVRGLTLPGGPDGALFYLTPNFSKLLEIQVWLEACLQVFYSLGPAWGGLITMSSYNGFHTNCMRNAIVCTFIGEGTSLFAGLVVFSILGFMANEAGVPVTEVVSSGPGLGFVIYPEALAQLPIPQLWSFIFFVMLILLALDSMFAMVETVLTSIMDEFPVLMKWRVTVTVVYCVLSFLAGLIVCTEGGMYIFQLADWYIVAIFLIFAGFLECVVVAWVYGVGRFCDDIEMMIGRQPATFFKIAWCYFTPLLLLTTLISTLYNYKPPNYGHYKYPDYAATIGWILAAVPMAPLPIMAGLAIYRAEGSLLERIKKSSRPDESWGPAKPSYRELYKDKVKGRMTIREILLSSVSSKA